MKKYTLYEFIEHVKNNKNNYINYCEILIDSHGCIIECIPSHQEAAIRYVMKKEAKTRDQVLNEIPTYCAPLEWILDKYGIIAVWYEMYKFGIYKGINRFQKRTMDTLLKHGIIKEGFVITAEYRNYLIRLGMGIESVEDASDFKR